MSTTAIEWAHESGNGAAGCTEARHADGTMSEECVNCYARLQSARMSGLMRGGAPSARKQQIAALYDGVADRAGRGARWSNVLRWDRELLDDVLDHLRPGKRTFLGSMTDLWHPGHDRVLGVALAEGLRRVALRPRNLWPQGVILLSKRAAEQLAWQQEHFPDGLPAFVWPGVTAGTQMSADERLPFATQLRASVIVVSAEPLLGALDLRRWLGRTLVCPVHGPTGAYGWTTDKRCRLCLEAGKNGEAPDLVRDVGPGLGWVIAGGESGAKARPSHRDWFTSLRDQCVATRVPFFFKQYGTWQDGSTLGTNRDLERTLLNNGKMLPSAFQREDLTPDEIANWGRLHAVAIAKVGKKAAGRRLDGRTWDEVPAT